MILPWDAFGLFRTAETSFQVTDAGFVQVALPNVMRVALMFGAPVNGNGIIVTTQPFTPIANCGIVLGNFGSIPFMLNNQQYGPLTQIGWFASCSAALAFLTVIEVFLEKDPCNPVSPMPDLESLVEAPANGPPFALGSVPSGVSARLPIIDDS